MDRMNPIIFVSGWLCAHAADLLSSLYAKLHGSDVCDEEIPLATSKLREGRRVLLLDPYIVFPGTLHPARQGGASQCESMSLLLPTASSLAGKLAADGS